MAAIGCIVAAEVMIMTEDKAKKKWCPMIRDGGTYYGMIFNGINSAENNTQGYTCIASDCMMWRWEGYNADGERLRRMEDNQYYGFCGLGGRL